MPRRPGYFNLLTHFPWVGLRTNDPEGAHIEYLRGIENPIGIKVGAGCTREQVARWLDMLDPDRTPGRLTFIHRFGARKIADGLPPLIEHVRAEGGKPVWICDPMHGNTQTTGQRHQDAQFRGHLFRSGAGLRHPPRDGPAAGRRAHRTDRRERHRVHRAARGGPSEADLARAYESEVDPRLNYEQSMELAFLIARKMKNGEH